MVGRRQPVVVQLIAQGSRRSRQGRGARSRRRSPRFPASSPPRSTTASMPAGDALEIRVDPAAAAMKGITPADVKEQVNHYLNGTVVTTLSRQSSGRGRAALGASRSGSQALSRRAQGPAARVAETGASFRLSAVATIEFVGGQPEITRENLAQVAAVTAEIGGGHDLGSTIAAVQKVLRNPAVLPPGVCYDHRRRLQAAAARRSRHDQGFAGRGGQPRSFCCCSSTNRFWVPLIIIVSVADLEQRHVLRPVDHRASSSISRR